MLLVAVSLCSTAPCFAGQYIYPLALAKGSLPSEKTDKPAFSSDKLYYCVIIVLLPWNTEPEQKTHI